MSLTDVALKVLDGISLLFSGKTVEQIRSEEGTRLEKTFKKQKLVALIERELQSKGFLSSVDYILTAESFGLSSKAHNYLIDSNNKDYKALLSLCESLNICTTPNKL